MIDHRTGSDRIAPQTLQPAALAEDYTDIKQAAIKVLQASLKLLAPVGKSADSAASAAGLPNLEAPSKLANANDISLRIGMLQDALNQLMAKVSKTEIKSRMNELQKENEQQLKKFEEQMKKAAEAFQKAQESQRKGNVFEAISNWIQAAVSIVSAVVTIVAAVGQMAVNPVGAAALFVAGAALLGAAAVQMTLAVDATLQAMGKEGFLSETQKANMKKAVEILGYIAIAASMIGLIGGVVVALGNAGKTATSLATKEAVKTATQQATNQAAKTAAKETTEEVGKFAAARMIASYATGVGGKSGAQVATSRYATYAFQQSLKQITRPLIEMAKALLKVYAAGEALQQINSGVGKLEVGKLQQQASDLQHEADQAAAATKAIAALIAKLQAMIEQLQQELEAMLEQGQQTLAIIHGTIDDNASSLTRIQHTTGA